MAKELIILFGIETEYGIARDGVEDLDVVAESTELTTPSRQRIFTPCQPSASTSRHERTRPRHRGP